LKSGGGRGLGKRQKRRIMKEKPPGIIRSLQRQ
jgi:hypothetical protein